jgi:hypothetical protein
MGARGYFFVCGPQVPTPGPSRSPCYERPFPLNGEGVKARNCPTGTGGC